MADLGKIIDGAIRFERLLPAPVERVWSYLTTSEYLPSWLAESDIDLGPGGMVELRFNVGAIIRGEVACPPRFS